MVRGAERIATSALRRIEIALWRVEQERLEICARLTVAGWVSRLDALRREHFEVKPASEYVGEVVAGAIRRIPQLHILRRRPEIDEGFPLPIIDLGRIEVERNIAIRIIRLHLADAPHRDDHVRIARVQVLVHRVDVRDLLEQLSLRVRVDLSEAGRSDLDMEVPDGAVLRSISSREPVLPFQEQRG